MSHNGEKATFRQISGRMSKKLKDPEASRGGKQLTHIERAKTFQIGRCWTLWACLIIRHLFFLSCSKIHPHLLTVVFTARVKEERTGLLGLALA